MRIVSYNILDGGEGRADPLGEVIEAQRPDIVALVEADDATVVERIARRLKMDFIIGPGKQHAVALLSAWPIRQSVNHALLSSGISRCCLEAVVITPGKSDLPIGVLHLPAGATAPDEDSRVADLRAILPLFQPYRQAMMPHLLVGDFNANADYQLIDPGQCKEKTRQAWVVNGQALPTRAIKLLTEAGYLDTYHARHDERQQMTGSFTTQEPGQRVDYIFSHGVDAGAITHAWVEQDRLAKYASDHYPVGAELGVL